MSQLRKYVQSLQELWTPVDPEVPGLQARVVRGTRFFVLIGGNSLWVGSARYMFNQSSPVLQGVGVACLVNMALFTGLLLWPRTRRHNGAVLFLQMSLFEFIWAAHNPISGNQDVLAHAMSFSLVGAVALFTPIAPRYLLAYGLVIAILDVLTLHHTVQISASYILFQFCVAMGMTLLAMFASQVQRRVYLRIHKNQQRQLAHDRLFTVGQRTEALVGRLRSPLHSTRQRLLDVRMGLQGLQRALQDTPGARQQAKHASPALHERLEGALQQAQALSHLLHQAHSPHRGEHGARSLREELLAWIKARHETMPSQEITCEVPPRLTQPGDGWAFSHLLSLLVLHALAEGPGQLHIRAEATLSGVRLHLRGTWRADLEEALRQGELASCRDMARALFQGDLQREASSLLLELNPPAAHSAQSFTPGFAPGRPT